MKPAVNGQGLSHPAAAAHGGGHGGRHGGGHDDRHGGHQRFLSQTFLRPINNLMDSFTNYFKVLVFLIQLSTLFLTIYHN